MLAGKLRMAPTCYHVLHLMPIMAAHEMNYFYEEGLRDQYGLKGIAVSGYGMDDDLRRSNANIDWRGSDRFVLTERRQFLTLDAGFADRLGRYAKVSEKLDDGRLVVDFSAEADCAISGGQYRIVGVRPGKFDD